MASEDRDDKEVTFNFSSDAEILAAQALEGEGKETPGQILARQQAEAADGEGDPEDRGDDFEPTDDEEKKEPTAEEAQALLDEAAKVADPAKPARPIMIPKDRFDEVNNKMKGAVARAEAAEAELTKLKTAAPAEEEYDFDAAELRYINAMMEEGDQEKALEIRKEIRAAEKASFESRTTGSVAQANVQSVVEDAFDTVLTSAIDLYPFLDSTKDTRDDGAIDMVIALKNQYLSVKGTTAAAALEKAVSVVGPLFSKTEAAVAKTPAQLRAEETIRRNAEASRQQPANIGKLGEQAGKSTVNVAKMSEKEFDALPEEELKRQRGDFV